MTLRFLLVCEGSSDAALIPHISKLLLQNGQSDPQGIAWTRSGPLPNKIRGGLEYSGACDLLLVHRDADSQEDTRSAGPQKRVEEIRSAVGQSEVDIPWAGVIPVQTTESWLLLDESAIRRAAGKPSGSVPLSLPTQTQVEGESDPKGCLERALLAASETSGRRREKFVRDIPHMRRTLLEELPVGGQLLQVPSWVRFRDDLKAVSDALST